MLALTQFGVKADIHRRKRLGIGPPNGTAEIHRKTLATMRHPEVLPGNGHDLGFFMALTRFAAAACFGETTGRFPGARRSSRNNPAISRARLAGLAAAGAVRESSAPNRWPGLRFVSSR